MIKNKLVLIFGCGSVGAHHANAASRLGYKVLITDINKKQFTFFKKKLYPGRYKKWDKKIKFIDYNEVYKLKISFNLIIVGTSPANHIPVLLECYKKLNFDNILVEKPFCIYNQDHKVLKKILNDKRVYCGFNHTLSESINFIFKILKKKQLGKIRYVKILWKEDFKNVMKAHPWRKSLGDSYLSNVELGGGGLHEYSHAAHLLMNIKEILFKNSPVNTESKIIFKKLKNTKYDHISNLRFKIKECLFELKINTFANPDIKEILLIGNSGSLLWSRKMSNFTEKIKVCIDSKLTTKNFKVTRPDDFINQIKVLETFRTKHEYLYMNNLKNSLKTMNFIKQGFVNNNV
jgi:predicted dehydrogenase